MLSFFRDAAWLDEARIRRVAIVLAAVLPIVLALEFWVHTHPDFVLHHPALDSAVDFPLGEDFVNTWSGAKLAASGRAADVYDLHAFQQYARTHALPFSQFRWYAYPPVTLLLTAPLALLPYLPAYLLWIVAGAALCALLLRRALGWPGAVLATVAAPTFLFNAVSGQNGMFTAALFTGGLMLLDKRPIISGVLFALLCCKPQLALLIPFALIAAGRWQAFLAAAATVAAVFAASVLLFGWQTWAAYMHVAPLNAVIMENGHLPALPGFRASAALLWHRMPTVFAAARLAGAPTVLAYVAQILSAFAALAVTVTVWRGPASPAVKGAVLIFATLAATAYAWDYDLPVVTFAVIWLWREAAKTGFLPWERFVLAGTLAATLLFGSFAHLTGVQAGPLLWWLALWAATRRAMT